MRALLSIEDPEVPDSVSVAVWTGAGELPEGVEDVEFFVPPYAQGLKPIRRALERMPALRVIQTLTAGIETIRPLVPEGVVLCNGKGIHDDSTAELVLALILAAQRDLADFVRGQARGEWRAHDTPGLADHTVLIVGHGSIGAAVERRLAGFEVDVLRVARRAREGVHDLSALPDLLPRADVVVILLPVTPETRGLVDAGFLAAMRDGALLVNVARGTIVDQQSLLAEVRAGRLRAALDVTDPEPLPPGSPLWTAPGVLVTPHVGGGTAAMLPRAKALVEAQLCRYAAGEPLANVISGDY